MEFLFDSANAPFLGAALLLLLFAALEVIGQLLGIAPSGWLDDILPGVDVDAPDIDAPDLDTPAIHAPDVEAVGHGDVDGDMSGGGTFGAILDWLNIGRVPALVVLISFLALFSAIGFALQSILDGLVGATMPAWIAWFVVLILALPPTRWVGSGLARLLPQDETYAEAMRNMVGRPAVITMGRVTRDRPGKARVKGRRGNTLWVRVRAARPDETFSPSDRVILSAFDGAVFDVVAAGASPEA